MRLFFSLLALCAFLALSAIVTRPSSAQHTLAGTVIDAQTGQGLPGASLQIAGTYTGTITSSSGAFELRSQSLPVTLMVRFIGYETLEKRVETNAGPLRIELQPSAITLPEITITGEDPAVRIMRRVIEEKQQWRAELSSYAVDAYNRFRMENDTGIVSIWESNTRAFWDRERGTREISLWQQQTQNMEIDAFMPAALFVVNLYDDDVEVAGHRLMGVTHPDALDHYRFRLESIEEGGMQDVFVISVAPRRDTFAGFNGIIRVLDDAYALLSVDMRPGESFLFPPPIQYVEIAYRQQFSSFEGSTWLPVDLKTEMDLKVGLDRILVFPPFRIRQTSRLSEFEINVPVPDSLYASNEVVVVDSSMVRMDTRPPDLVAVPLSEQEVRAYATIDSTMTIEKAYEPSGALARFVNTEDDSGSSGGSGRSASRQVGKVHINLTPSLWYNRVEGWHLGARPTVRLSRHVRLLGKAAYATELARMSGFAGLQLGGDVGLRVTVGDETACQIPSSVKSAFINSADVMIGSTDYFDYYRQRGVQAQVFADDFLDRDVDVKLMWGLEEHSSLDQGLTSSMIGRTLDDTVNPAVREGDLSFVRVELTREKDNAPAPIGPQRSITLRGEWSLAGDIVESRSYSRYELDLLWRIDTFFRRRMIPNSLDVRLVAGIASEDAPPQRWGAVDGVTILSTFGGLRTAEAPPYVGNQWALFAWEHSFRTLPFEWMNWRGAIKRQWQVIVHGASGWSRFIGDGPDAPLLSGILAVPDGHHEMGLSLSGLFTLLRLDTTWRLDQPGLAVGLSVSRIF